jgi:2-aminoadipate transaminase
MTTAGPDLDVLERTLLRPEVKLFYTMPSFHNPMGITTGLPHRRALLDIAARTGKPLIEDAFEMDLRFDGVPVPPLAALDREGLVVHLFSFSKSLFPGVRVGAITASDRAVGGLLALKHAADLSGALILQAAVAEFVRNGDYHEHLVRLRRALAERCAALGESLSAHLPSAARWTLPEGGYQLWLELPPGLDTRALLRDAQQAGVIYAPGCQFHHDGRPSSALRLSIALCGVEEIRLGIERLGRVVGAHLRGGAELPRDTTIHL